MLDRKLIVSVKAMPGSIPAPKLVHSIIEKKENIGSQMGHTCLRL